MDNTNHSRPKIKGIAPYIEVFDMPKSIQFYRDVLGFKVVGSSGEGDDVDWVMLQLDDAQFMLNTAFEKDDRPAQLDPLRTKGHEDIIFYFGCPDVDGLYRYFSDKKVDIIKGAHITGYGWRAINIKDPDGYGLCFHCPQE